MFTTGSTTTVLITAFQGIGLILGIVIASVLTTLIGLLGIGFALNKIRITIQGTDHRTDDWAVVASREGGVKYWPKHESNF